MGDVAGAGGETPDQPEGILQLIAKLENIVDTMMPE